MVIRFRLLILSEKNPQVNRFTVNLQRLLPDDGKHIHKKQICMKTEQNWRFRTFPSRRIKNFSELPQYHVPGAGYAGGIMSAAVDGLRVARAIIGRYAPAEG